MPRAQATARLTNTLALRAPSSPMQVMQKTRFANLIDDTTALHPFTSALSWTAHCGQNSRGTKQTLPRSLATAAHWSGSAGTSSWAPVQRSTHATHLMHHKSSHVSPPRGLGDGADDLHAWHRLQDVPGPRSTAQFPSSPPIRRPSLPFRHGRGDLFHLGAAVSALKFRRR
jgi:hypothetical protein